MLYSLLVAYFSPQIYGSQQNSYTYSQQFLSSAGERGDREGTGIGIGILRPNFAYPGNIFLPLL